MQRVVIATTNPHKIEEFRAILADVACELVSPANLDVSVAVEETGATFADNAVLKAIAYAEALNLPALADDSGLEIDALGGEPGVYSARWAGEQTSYPERFRLLFERLRGLPPDARTARYRCVIALAEPRPNGLYDVSNGTLEGQIALEPRGTGGFGYDPIFYVPTLRKTVGELSPDEKHRISHRAQAAAVARQALMRLLERRPAAVPV
jgi:XTP/dITP diphosphohydrolase